MASAAAPPTLDPADGRFVTELEVLAVRAPRREIGGLMRLLKRHTLARPRTHKVVHLPPDVAGGEQTSLILLDESTCAPGADRETLPRVVREAVGLASPDPPADDSEARDAQSLDASSASQRTAFSLITHVLTLGYDSLSAEEALRRVLPSDVVVPTGFETAGTIAHLNLRSPEHDDHAQLIGAVLLDKLPQIKTVVNKTGETGGPFRTFAMEVLAGEGGRFAGPLITTAHENGVAYEFDFRNVYWNSRLGTERKRLVDSFASEDVVLDLCCGVGPIALPAARKTKAAFANDLNPDAVAFLRKNDARHFKATGVKLAGITNMNARDCVAAMVRFDADETTDTVSASERGSGTEVSRKEQSPPLYRFTQAVMNLPEGSLDLLSCFRGAFDKETWPPATLPRINAYAFSKDVDPERDVATRAAAALGLEPTPESLGDPGTVHYRRVRAVAPGKYMMLLSFRVPERAAYEGAGGD
jgi:tRNA (guanine37-N1)-methyltransferase